jgi:hypothetical protein
VGGVGKRCVGGGRPLRCAGGGGGGGGGAMRRLLGEWRVPEIVKIMKKIDRLKMRPNFWRFVVCLCFQW